MLAFKSTKLRFYLIVGILIMLFGTEYLQLAIFLGKLKKASETVQSSSIITRDIKNLEKEFWMLRFWEKVLHTQNHPDAEKQFGMISENIRKKLSELTPVVFTNSLSEKTLRIFRFMSEYHKAFDQLMQFRTDQQLNQTRIKSSYQVLSSTVLMADETVFIKLVRNLDRFINAYLQNRKNSEYQAFKMVFGVLKNNLSRSEIMDDRIKSYVENLENFMEHDFILETKIQDINKRFDDISHRLSNQFSAISVAAETLSSEAMAASQHIHRTLQQWFLVTAGIVFILLMLIISLIKQTIITPIRNLSDVVMAVKAGKEDTRFASNSRNDIAELGFAFNDMLDTINRHRYHLEELVEKRTVALNHTLAKVREANIRIMDSIQYAKMIQRSLLPNIDDIKTYLPNSFFIWEPRDVVGGDIFYADRFENSLMLAVVDCTGHGVPGAFMTMIASSALRRVINDEGYRDPAQILKRINFIVKTTLQQDSEHAYSDDGMDAAICFVSPDENKLIFAGAKLSLIYVHNETAEQIKGDRQSIGYRQSRRSDIHFEFTNHTIPLQNRMRFYMYTDGFTDQMGGERSRVFGKKRFRKLLLEISPKPFDEQQKILFQVFHEYKGNNESVDDMTIVGFGFEERNAYDEYPHI